MRERLLVVDTTTDKKRQCEPLASSSEIWRSASKLQEDYIVKSTIHAANKQYAYSMSKKCGYYKYILPILYAAAYNTVEHRYSLTIQHRSPPAAAGVSSQEEERLKVTKFLIFQLKG